MNSKFEVKKMALEGVKLITPLYVGDDRGYFLKSMDRDSFRRVGLDTDFYEDFESYSKKNVIRGMHFQTPYPQAKLVRAVIGTIYDVIVDLRKDSETFGKWMGVELSSNNHCGLWIPAGFAHGYKVISDEAIVAYKCIGKYYIENDTGIKWNDPDLAIDWMIDEPIISIRDSELQSFQEFISKYQYL